jgi:hypothetical protein
MELKRLWDNFIRSNEVDLSKFDTEGYTVG